MVLSGVVALGTFTGCRTSKEPELEPYTESTNVDSMSTQSMLGSTDLEEYTGDYDVEELNMIIGILNCSYKEAEGIVKVLNEHNVKDFVSIAIDDEIEDNSIIVETDGDQFYEVGINDKFQVYLIIDQIKEETLFDDESLASPEATSTTEEEVDEDVLNDEKEEDGGYLEEEMPSTESTQTQTAPVEIDNGNVVQ